MTLLLSFRFSVDKLYFCWRCITCNTNWNLCKKTSDIYPPSNCPIVGKSRICSRAISPHQCTERASTKMLAHHKSAAGGQDSEQPGGAWTGATTADIGVQHIKISNDSRRPRTICRRNQITFFKFQLQDLCEILVSYIKVSYRAIVVFPPSA